MNTTHVMVDLETMGKVAGSIIASIGAIAFNPFTGEIGRTFYAVIDERSCVDVGLVTDDETVEWWADPDRAAALAALSVDPRPIENVLADFDVYWGKVQGEQFWCQGPSFDLVLLEAAYKAVGWAVPWRYNAGRCTRTVYEQTGIRPDTTKGVYHNALDDCAMQIDAIVAGYRRLGLCPTPTHTKPSSEGDRFIGLTAGEITEKVRQEGL